MVRGNWQRRVELTEARRTAAKQKKQRQSNRAEYRTLGQELITLLSKHTAEEEVVLHLWTEKEPSNHNVTSMMEDSSLPSHSAGGEPTSNSCGGKRRNRSSSQGSETDHHGSKKKAHPRSKESLSSLPPQQEDVSQLCRAQFFSSKCPNQHNAGKKALRCPHVHYTLNKKNNNNKSRQYYQTLEQVLSSHDATISAENAMLQANDDMQDDDGGGMPLLYHITTNISRYDGQSESTTTLGDLMSQSLSQQGLNATSVVYCCIGDQIIFDRYQGGNVASDIDDLMLSGRKRSPSTAHENESWVQFTNLPGLLLEHMLTYLSDSHVGTMKRVCRAWNAEIGTTSPQLWRFLLERRNWPLLLLPQEDDDNDESTTFVLQASFTTHYQIIRDVNAIKTALTGLIYPNQKAATTSGNKNEMAIHTFATLRDAPSTHSDCMGMLPWSGGQVLAAYKNDCTLRLFSARPGSGWVRQVQSVCVDPYQNTKRKTSQLIAMDADEENIACLIRVCDNNEQSVALNFVLTVITKDDYLVSSEGGGELIDGNILKVIDIGNAMKHYAISMDEDEHPHLYFLFEEFWDYADGDDDDTIHNNMGVVATKQVLACGYGRFLIDIDISFPYDYEEEHQPSGRALVMFSTTANAIVWVSDSITPQVLSDIQLTGSVYSPGMTSRTVIATSTGAGVVLQAEIDLASGQVSRVYREGALEHLAADRLGEWFSHYRLQTVSLENDFILVDIWSDRPPDGPDDGTRPLFKSIITILSKDYTSGETSDTIVLDGCKVAAVSPLRGSHVVLFSEESVHSGDEFDGDWFGGSQRTELLMLVLHVPSRQIIYRKNLTENADFHAELDKYNLCICPGDTIGVGVWWRGVILTGPHVRNASLEQELGSPGGGKTPKKKKKGFRVPKPGKKDGFARGLSMRG